MARTPRTSVAYRASARKQRADEALQQFLSLLESGRFPDVVARSAVLTRASDAPSAKWSAGNQAIMLAHGTMDARGYRQWQEVGRQVKKGAKAFHILRPNTRVITEVDEETGEEVKKTVVTGFAFTPVFRIEDTEGEPLPEYDPPTLPPLVEVAEEFGVDVKYAPQAGPWYGYYQPGAETIVLCTHNERVFFHELAHAAHYRLTDNAVTPESCKVRKEIVAETAAAALCRLYGYEYGRIHADYLAHYAESGGDTQKTLREIMRYIGEVRAVLDLILDTAERIAERKGEAA